MHTPTDWLDGIQIARPCTAKWEEMTGDERVRRCSLCDLDVYDLSAMSRAQAEAFVRARSGRTCVRFWRRADGTLLTADCPVGLRAALRRGRVAAAAVLAAGFLALAMLFPGRDESPTPSLFQQLCDVVLRFVRGAPPPVVTMGDVCVPSPAPSPVPSPPPAPVPPRK